MGSILNEIIPRMARLVLYVIVFFTLLALGAWKAAEGDVVEAITAFLTSLAPLLAAGNITPPEEKYPVPSNVNEFNR